MARPVSSRLGLDRREIDDRLCTASAHPYLNTCPDIPHMPLSRRQPQQETKRKHNGLHKIIRHEMPLKPSDVVDVVDNRNGGLDSMSSQVYVLTKQNNTNMSGPAYLHHRLSLAPSLSLCLSVSLSLPLSLPLSLSVCFSPSLPLCLSLLLSVSSSLCVSLSPSLLSCLSLSPSLSLSLSLSLSERCVWHHD